GRAYPSAHILFAPGDEGGARTGHPGARRSRGSLDDAALHAPESCSNGRRDPIARRTTIRSRTHAKVWRHSGHATGRRQKQMRGKGLVERATGIEIDAPGFNLRLRVREADKPVLVQALIAKLAIEALHVRVLDRLAGSDEAERHLRGVGPRF